MHPGWSALRARVSNRLAWHLGIAPLQLSGTGPMVSFTFDDVPKSAATIGAPLLEQYDARGTFYVAGGLLILGAILTVALKLCLWPLQNTATQSMKKMQAQSVPELVRIAEKLGLPNQAERRG